MVNKLNKIFWKKNRKSEENSNKRNNFKNHLDPEKKETNSIYSNSVIKQINLLKITYYLV